MVATRNHPSPSGLRAGISDEPKNKKRVTRAVTAANYSAPTHQKRPAPPRRGRKETAEITVTTAEDVVAPLPSTEAQNSIQVDYTTVTSQSSHSVESREHQVTPKKGTIATVRSEGQTTKPISTTLSSLSPQSSQPMAVTLSTPLAQPFHYLAAASPSPSLQPAQPVSTTSPSQSPQLSPSHSESPPQIAESRSTSPPNHHTEQTETHIPPPKTKKRARSSSSIRTGRPVKRVYRDQQRDDNGSDADDDDNSDDDVVCTRQSATTPFNVSYDSSSGGEATTQHQEQVVAGPSSRPMRTPKSVRPNPASQTEPKISKNLSTKRNTSNNFALSAAERADLYYTMSGQKLPNDIPLIHKKDKRSSPAEELRQLRLQEDYRRKRCLLEDDDLESDELPEYSPSKGFKNVNDWTAGRKALKLSSPDSLEVAMVEAYVKGGLIGRRKSTKTAPSTTNLKSRNSVLLAPDSFPATSSHNLIITRHDLIDATKSLVKWAERDSAHRVPTAEQMNALLEQFNAQESAKVAASSFESHQSNTQQEPAAATLHERESEPELYAAESDTSDVEIMEETVQDPAARLDQSEVTPEIPEPKTPVSQAPPQPQESRGFWSGVSQYLTTPLNLFSRRNDSAGLAATTNNHPVMNASPFQAPSTPTPPAPKSALQSPRKDRRTPNSSKNSMSERQRRKEEDAKLPIHMRGRVSKETIAQIHAEEDRLATARGQKRAHQVGIDDEDDDNENTSSSSRVGQKRKRGVRWPDESKPDESDEENGKNNSLGASGRKTKGSSSILRTEPAVPAEQRIPAEAPHPQSKAYSLPPFDDRKCLMGHIYQFNHLFTHQELVQHRVARARLAGVSYADYDQFKDQTNSFKDGDSRIVGWTGALEAEREFRQSVFDKYDFQEELSWSCHTLKTPKDASSITYKGQMFRNRFGDMEPSEPPSRARGKNIFGQKAEDFAKPGHAWSDQVLQAVMNKARDEDEAKAVYEFSVPYCSDSDIDSDSDDEDGNDHGKGKGVAKDQNLGHFGTAQSPTRVPEAERSTTQNTAVEKNVPQGPVIEKSATPISEQNATQDSEPSALQEKQWTQTPPPKPRPGNAQLPHLAPPLSAAELAKAKAEKHKPREPSNLRHVTQMSPMQMDKENKENKSAIQMNGSEMFSAVGDLTPILEAAGVSWEQWHATNEYMDNLSPEVIEAVYAIPEDQVPPFALPSGPKKMSDVDIAVEAFFRVYPKE